MMTFRDVLDSYADFDFSSHVSSVNDSRITSILDKDNLVPQDFLALLSPAAQPHLEAMAERAQAITRRHFGNVIFLFTPLYISNYCENVCPYCSFARQHKIDRRQLALEEIRTESAAIAATGMRNILVLTGESRHGASVEYITQALSVIREHFASVSIEMYPMTQGEYVALLHVGADGFTMYQEAYDEKVYRGLHTGGPKADYQFRLDAPQRAAAAGMRTVTLGPLLGLADPVHEAFFCGLHARYIQKKYPSVEVAVSFPRLRPMAGEFEPAFIVDDRQFVQFILASRLFLPQCGITVSTRESQQLRDAIVNLGITKMSAGVSTAVGGHSKIDESTAQFEIADSRSLDKLKSDLCAKGLQPVTHDWNSKFIKQEKNADITQALA